MVMVLSVVLCSCICMCLKLFVIFVVLVDIELQSVALGVKGQSIQLHVYSNVVSIVMSLQMSLFHVCV